MISIVKRIAIVGCIGAGKSTLARQLGHRLGIEVIHLDRLWWQPGPYRIKGKRTVAARTLAPGEFRKLQERLAAQDSWIIDGGAADLSVRLSRADTVVSSWICLGGSAPGGFSDGTTASGPTIPTVYGRASVGSSYSSAGSGRLTAPGDVRASSRRSRSTPARRESFTCATVVLFERSSSASILIRPLPTLCKPTTLATDS